MLDNLYKNIGGKIKSWAKWIFIIEAISAIIAGFVLFFVDDSLILFGLLTLVCGPFFAWVGSWVLYGFGELIEKTCDNENNTKQILEILNEKTYENEFLQNKNTPTQTSITFSTYEPAEKTEEHWKKQSTFSATDSGNIVCSQCNFEQPSGRKVCWHCGAKF